MTDKILSVFIDESGDFGAYEHHAPYDLVAMVLHDQRVNIAADIHGMDERMRNLGYDHHTIHTGSLIRRESTYANDMIILPRSTTRIGFRTIWTGFRVHWFIFTLRIMPYCRRKTV